MLPPQVAGFVSQPALARALPALAGVGALAAAASLWIAVSSGRDRVLYTSLTDAELLALVLRHRAEQISAAAKAELEARDAIKKAMD